MKLENNMTSEVLMFPNISRRKEKKKEDSKGKESYS